MGEGLAKSLASLSQQERDQVSKQELTSEHWSYPERHEATSEENAPNLVSNLSGMLLGWGIQDGRTKCQFPFPSLPSGS